MLEGLPQSNYDKIKTDLEKEISEIDSIKSRLNELKEQKLQENIVRFESMKIQVRNQKKAFIKQINAEETKNLKIIEEKELKFKTELLNLAFFNENNISKQSLAENKLKEEELKNLKAELFKFKNSLNGKIEKLEKLKDGSNFILKIIQEMVFIYLFILFYFLIYACLFILNDYLILNENNSSKFSQKIPLKKRIKKFRTQKLRSIQLETLMIIILS